MQFINERARQIAEAQTVAAVLSIASHARWLIDHDAPTILSPAFRDYLYVPQAELILVPTLGHPNFGLVSGLVREARADALCIMIGRSSAGNVQIYASICEWSRNGAHWWGPHMALVDEAQRLWFVPDPVGGNEPEPSFRVGAGRLVRTAEQQEGDLDEGLARARSIFSNLEGR